MKLTVELPSEFRNKEGYRNASRERCIVYIDRKCYIGKSQSLPLNIHRQFSTESADKWERRKREKRETITEYPLNTGLNADHENAL